MRLFFTMIFFVKRQWPFRILILAAGRGSRMPGFSKLTLEICGKKSILYSVEASLKAEPMDISIVLPSEGLEVEFPASVKQIFQSHPQGTGDSAQYALNKLEWFDNPCDTLFLLGDSPLIETQDIHRLIESRKKYPDVDIWVLGFHVQANHVHTYGRLILNEHGYLESILEDKYATEEQKKNSLCNSGVMLFSKDHGLTCLKDLCSRNDSAHQELYITDVISLAHKRGLKCRVLETLEPLYGMNTSEDVDCVFQSFQKRWRKKLQSSGAILYDPQTIFVRENTIAHAGAIIYPHVVFGDDVELASGSIIESFSFLEGVTVASGARIGPFARIRGKSIIEAYAQIGSFVDLKSSYIGEKSKIKHLAYIGDTHMGQRTNIGAGTVICNYDGYEKHSTHIGSDVFVGANNSLVAPVILEDQCKTGAHSCITRQVEKGAIAVSRSPQKNFFVSKES